MNYSRRSVTKIQNELISRGVKFKKMGLVILLELLLLSIAAVVVGGVCVGLGAFNGIISSSPDISSLDVTPKGYATVVYDSEGHEMTKLIAENSNRTYVTMDKIPQNLADAFVAIEDRRFYNHNGIDIEGIAAAAVDAARTRDLNRGASTITQQLLKNNVFEGWVNQFLNFT